MESVDIVTLKSESKKINIDGSIDQFYRYKMRQLQLKYFGRDKMVKTFFPNVKDVEKDLKVPSKYIVAFLGYSSHRKFGYDEKRKLHYISGSVFVKEISDYMRSLIDILVLCQKCGLPELIINVELKTLWGTCKSCGMKYRLHLNEKFEKYISKKTKCPTNDKNEI